MITPAFLKGKWLLPPEKANDGVGSWDGGCCNRKAANCMVVAAARPGKL
jgi:hypothetical protein